MSETWIVVADQAGARIFGADAKLSSLDLIHEIPHPEGRLKDGEIDTDRPGRAFDSKGAGRHAMETEESASQRVAMVFAHQLARVLDEGRQKQSYRDLFLVAAPRFLGSIRKALTAPTAATVAGSLAKDLTHVPVHDLLPHLQVARTRESS